MVPVTAAEWAAYVSALDARVGSRSVRAVRAEAAEAPTVEEIDEIIRNASAQRGGGGGGGAGGLSRGLDTAQRLVGNLLEMIEDPAYTVAMMALIWYLAESPTAAIGAAASTVMEIARAAQNVALVEERARAAFSRFFVPMSTDKKSDALACLLYACAASASHVASAMGAGLGLDAEAKLSAAFAGLAAEYTQVDVGLCAPMSMDRETYSGVTDGIAAVAQLEVALRLVPGIAALARQWRIPNAQYSAQYAPDVDALVGAVKGLVLDSLTASARRVVDQVLEYKTTRLVFYLLVAIAFGYSSFLYALLVLESPLCARIVAKAVEAVEAVEAV
jgi:hypothetical protein